MLNLLGEDAGWDKAGRPVTWCLTLAKLPLGSLEAGPTPKGMLVFEANLTLPEARAFSRVFSFFLNGSQIFPSLSIQFWFPHIAIQRGQLLTCSLHIPPNTHTHVPHVFSPKYGMALTSCVHFSLALLPPQLRTSPGHKSH